MQLEQMQQTAKAHTTRAFGLLSRFLVVFFAATGSVALTATVLGQQPALTAEQTQGSVKTLAAATTKNELNTEQPYTATDTAASAIRPFHINVPQEALDDLRRRIGATRWPEQETVTDQSQGVQLAAMKKLASYWQTDYDWRKVEARLKSLPQFVTTIDGLDIHFIQVKSRHVNALPLIITHGWPGSIIEQLKVIGPLTDPTAYGGRAEDAFDVVIPSLPGYAFSGKPTTTGWDPARIARAWVVLMKRLGYTKFVAQGGDWGSPVSNEMGKLAPPELLGIHVNLPGTIPPELLKAVQTGDPPPSGLADDERRAFDEFKVAFGKRRAYAAWMIDHGDGWGQPAAPITSATVGRTVNGHPAGDLTRDDVLDDITLYWVTNTAISSARLYWENKANLYLPANVSIPAAVSVFPGENYEAPRSWAERAYHKLIYFNRVAAGGHYAAWEQPTLFAQEVRAGFRPLRKSI